MMSANSSAGAFQLTNPIPEIEMPKIPDLIAIDHDDYHAEHVGKTRDGRQFFLTTPFVPGHEFVALYLFDKEGKFLEAHIDDFGPRSSMDDEQRAATYAKRLSELGEVSFERIEISPFSIEEFGVTFGLLPDLDDEDVVSMIVEPGNYMAFYEPWDSGDYDT